MLGAMATGRLGWLVSLARPEAKRLAAATVMLLAGSGLTLSYPLVIGRLVDVISGGEGWAGSTGSSWSCWACSRCWGSRPRSG